MKKSLVYFILYLVLLTELLVVITERDEAEEVQDQIRDKMLSSMATSYKNPLLLAIPQPKTDFNLGDPENKEVVVVMTPIGLVSDEEKKSVEFHVEVAPGSSTPAGWPSGGLDVKNGNESFKIVRSDDGNGKLVGKIETAGDFQFKAYCKVERQLPSYLPEFLLEALKEMVGEQKTAKSPVQPFSISAKRQGGKVSKGIEVY
ncbi:MAG: hypothetical protein COZ80_03265 [Ignavibacteria bacterium CG_4_8_14_3_um_filter_37_9]|nr:hypothetical protein [Ignavibacteria bacterium]OIO22977.1 MAG: hypothetical protein AUJ54_02610 [Ignavibacteria bacterium CG1_02_37_35]PIW99851.1 MAG: hypothetical protein COZ80_03265 [Ignavibacteria bacterium CG_4_8_14_3_um_filter_37_9]PIX95238.1 MAG: hypothetical protein COZ25_01455 [Ignavibacteria bacterium CG_4_10_14_3_um_filter_37_18]PJC61019.1 MAG: hypothetical protein CO025_01205 [Ignavibacteria bacterium CG_4_9_14_0_2_um_filter_37_13]